MKYMKWYYMLWVDAIQNEFALNGKNGGWKSKLIWTISVCQGINIASIFVFLVVKFKILLVIPIHFMPTEKLDNILSGFVTFILIPMLLNYLLIYRNNRYEALLKKYPPKDGKIIRSYILATFGIFVIPLVIGKLFFGL